MADSNEQAPQSQQPEQPPKRHKLGRKIAALALGVGAAIGIPAAVMHDNGEARPAPTTSSATPEASNGGESNEAMTAEFDKIKAPALASARTLLEKIPADIRNTDDRLRISIDSATVGHYSPNISAEATPENGQILVNARDGEGGHSNSLTYTFKVNDKGIFEDNKVTRDEFTNVLSDPTKVEIAEIQVVDVENNAVVGVAHSGSGPTERFNGTDAALGEQNTYTFREPAEIAQFYQGNLQPAITAATTRFTQ